MPEGKFPPECMFQRKVQTVPNSMLPLRKTNKPLNEDRTVIRNFQVDKVYLSSHIKVIENGNQVLSNIRLHKYCT